MSNFKHTFLYALLCVSYTLFASCTSNNVNKPNMVQISDSTMMSTDTYEIHKIHVGDKITNIPLCSQIVEINGKEKYMMLDETCIYIFDWDSGTLEDSIPTTACGELLNYSGFSYISDNKIAVLNSVKRILYIINNKGNIISQTQIPYGSENRNQYVSTIQALNRCRIEENDSQTIVSGSVFGCLKDIKKNLGDMPVSDGVQLTNGTCMSVVNYPTVYYENNYGINYMNTVYMTRDNDNNMLYSFPVLNKVLRYRNNFAECDTIIMQSRYDTGIKPCNITLDDIKKNETLETRYYISQLSYSSILYDPYRNVYIRAVEHKLDKWKPKDYFTKPMSFIISDTDGKILSETPIIKGSKNFIHTNMHICKRGMAIAIDNKDENNIYFACFKINKK